MTLIQPQDLYPAQAAKPSFQLLDVRAPIEVERGAMPYSFFEPILNNEERHQVGLCYREKGQEAAITLGYALTAPHMPKRIESWRKTCAAAPTAIACWRGGLRSKLATEFIARSDVPRIEGGYKGLAKLRVGGTRVCYQHEEIYSFDGSNWVGEDQTS